VEKQVGSATPTVYIFSGTKVIAEYKLGGAAASPNKEYIYAGASLLATIASGTTTYHHPDHLSVRLTTDTNGNLVGQQANFPFGEAWYSSSTTTKWRFTGYERDNESGNDYATARPYVNRLGRFASPDPVAGSTSNPQSLNRFAYVRNDPARLVDPRGATSQIVCLLDNIGNCIAIFSFGADPFAEQEASFELGLPPRSSPEQSQAGNSQGGSCAYMNNSGTAVESTDSNSNPSECGANGGVWQPGADSSQSGAPAPPPPPLNQQQCNLMNQGLNAMTDVVSIWLVVQGTGGPWFAGVSFAEGYGMSKANQYINNRLCGGPPVSFP
jgi:RHS repeat-associated protein